MTLTCRYGRSVVTAWMRPAPCSVRTCGRCSFDSMTLVMPSPQRRTTQSPILLPRRAERALVRPTAVFPAAVACLRSPMTAWACHVGHNCTLRLDRLRAWSGAVRTVVAVPSDLVRFFDGGGVLLLVVVGLLAVAARRRKP